MSLSDFKDATLVPVDFSENSLTALEHAGAIAHLVSHDKHKIVLHHVLEGVEMDEPYLQGDPLPDNLNRSLMIEGVIARFEKIMEEKLKDVDAEVKYLISGGKVYKQVPQIAEKIDADNIVMGTEGAEGFQAFLVSNAARVIQIAKCPIVVVRERHFDQGYNNIVLPLDLTKETKQKVNWATKIGQYYDATIHIVTVSEEDEFLKKRINNNMHQVEGILEENGVKYTSNYLTDTHGNFADTTLDFAKSQNADLIMVMTQQERSFKEYIFGSYAQQIVSKSRIPVMCITPRADIRGKFELAESWYGIR